MAFSNEELGHSHNQTVHHRVVNVQVAVASGGFLQMCDFTYDIGITSLLVT